MTKKTTTEKPTDDQIVSTFQLTAEATGGDIFAACRECNSPEVITRECLFDYLDVYGGESGKAVAKWIAAIDFDDLDDALDAAGVPSQWT